MDICIRCERNENEVKLLDALDDKEVIKICEECAFSENIPILRKPTSFQLKESEKPYSIRQRLSRMAGIKEEEKKGDVGEMARKIIQNVNLDALRKRDLKKEMDDKFKLAVERNKPLNLVENYNWLILMERKKRKIMRKQLAEAVGETEEIIKMIENKELPDDALRIIQKIEQYFSIRLRKDNSNSVFSLQRKESESRFAGIKIADVKEEKQIEKTEEKKEEPVRVLRFDPKKADKLTIHDLQRIKEAREKAAKENNKNSAGKEIRKELDVSEMIWKAKDNKKEGFAIGEKSEESLGEVEFEE